LATKLSERNNFFSSYLSLNLQIAVTPTVIKKEGKFLSSSLVERIWAGRGSCLLGVELLSSNGFLAENEM